MIKPEHADFEPCLCGAPSHRGECDDPMCVASVTTVFGPCDGNHGDGKPRSVKRWDLGGGAGAFLCSPCWKIEKLGRALKTAYDRCSRRWDRMTEACTGAECFYVSPCKWCRLVREADALMERLENEITRRINDAA